MFITETEAILWRGLDIIQTPAETTVNYNSDTGFFQLANGMEYDRVWKIIAELMETLQVINPRLYAGVIKKLKS